MKNYLVGYNRYYRTGHITLEEAPWWVFFLQLAVMELCNLIPEINLLPPIPVKRELDGEIYNTTLREWYGGLHSNFHVYVCDPIINWTQSKIREVDIDAPIEIIEELFYRDKSERREQDEAERKEWLDEWREDLKIDFDLYHIEFKSPGELDAILMFVDELRKASPGVIVAGIRKDSNETIDIDLNFNQLNRDEILDKAGEVGKMVYEKYKVLILFG